MRQITTHTHTEKHRRIRERRADRMLTTLIIGSSCARVHIHYCQVRLRALRLNDPKAFSSVAHSSPRMKATSLISAPCALSVSRWQTAPSASCKLARTNARPSHVARWRQGDERDANMEMIFTRSKTDVRIRRRRATNCGAQQASVCVSVCASARNGTSACETRKHKMFARATLRESF